LKGLSVVLTASTGLIEQITARLQHASETPALDAQVLLAHILGRSRTWVLAHPEASLNLEQHATLERKAARLIRGEPLPYVLGHWEFFGMDFTVGSQILIPRPETELLVEQALIWLRAQPRRRWAVDVGTGSGCIALALARHCADLQIIASDISSAALELARENRRRHALTGRVELIQADLLPALAHPVDLICANLPYIASSKLASLQVSLWEPRLALDGGQDGLSLLRRLLMQAPGHLKPGGLLLMEIEASQGEKVYCLARQAFPQAKIDTLSDLAGRERLARVQN